MTVVKQLLPDCHYVDFLVPYKRGSFRAERDMIETQCCVVVYCGLVFSRATYSKYRDTPSEASRAKCLAQGHNIIWHSLVSNLLLREPSD